MRVLWAVVFGVGFASPAVAVEGSPDLNCDGGINVTDVQIVILGALNIPLSSSIDANSNGIHDSCEVGGPVPDPVADTNDNGIGDICESLPLVADVSCSGSPCSNCPAEPTGCDGSSGFGVDENFASSGGCGSPFVMTANPSENQGLQIGLALVKDKMLSNGVGGDGPEPISFLMSGSGILNRYGHEISTLSAYTGYLGSFSVGNGNFLERGFKFGGSTSSSTADFNDGLSDKDFWEVQGVTGTYDAIGQESEYIEALFSNGTWKRFLMASFYHSDELGNGADFPKGVRIALTEITELDGSGSSDDVRYRLILLVSPATTAVGTGTFGPLLYDGGEKSNHAGGLVWYRGEDGKNLLYVPDTKTGIRIFDLDQILEVSNTDDKEAIGIEGDGTYSAYGYRYVLPEVARYRLCSSSCCVRFSTLSLDRSSETHHLVVGEYDADSDKNRVIRWPLNHKTGLPLTQEPADGSGTPVWVASASYGTGISKVQGALMLGDHVFISTTQTGSEGLSYTHGKCFHADYHGGDFKSTMCPSYPEDLYYDGVGIWTCTEKPTNRYCVRYNRGEFSDL